LKPWMLWLLIIFGVWLLWRMFRALKRARVEAPLREAARIADELIRRYDIEEMKAAYHRGDPAGRLGAVLALAGIESDEALEPLVEAMDDPNIQIRLIAGKALAKIRRKEALAALTEKGLQDASPLVRASVMHSLGERGDADAVPAVAKAVKQALSNPMLRTRELEVGANALALLGDRRGMWVLKDAQQSDVKRVREAAKRAQNILELRGRLERNPQDANAARQLGILYIASNEFVRARSALARAVELDPADAAARRVLGAVHAELDEAELAVAQYQEAARLAPEDPAIQAALGDTLVRAERFGQAQQAYRRYLELAPDGPDAGRIRKALRRLR